MGSTDTSSWPPTCHDLWMSEDYEPGLVSVIIPTYNRAHLLPRAIGSALRQTYSNLELIVVDDASTDETAEIVKTTGDARVRYVRHEENRGGGAARNTGIRLARGEFLAFLDSDDEWLPEKVAHQLHALRGHGDVEFRAVLTGGVRRWCHGSTVVREVVKRPAATGDVAGEVFRGIDGVNYVSVLVETSLALRVGGFDEALTCGQDWDFVARMAKLAPIASVSEALAVYYYHDGPKITRDLEGLITGTRRLISKHKVALQEAGTLWKWWQNLSRYAILAGHRRTAVTAIANCARHAPLHEKLIVASWLLLVIVPPRSVRWFRRVGRNLGVRFRLAHDARV
jgi:glycosyltransferase involved in cell wall biosynthesis